jgi:hypothetical protein
MTAPYGGLIDIQCSNPLDNELIPIELTCEKHPQTPSVVDDGKSASGAVLPSSRGNTLRAYISATRGSNREAVYDIRENSYHACLGAGGFGSVRK